MFPIISFDNELIEHRHIPQQLFLISAFFLVTFSGCNADFEDKDVGGDRDVYWNDDTDSDVDRCPENALKILPGFCGCNVADTDTDGDGTPDCNDNCPEDPRKTEPGNCGCGVPQNWYPDCDGDGQFSHFPTNACSQEGADAAFKCQDGSNPDGGWSTSPGNDVDDESEFDTDDDSFNTDGWFGDGWQYRRQISILRSQVAGTHSFFPIVISSTLDSWKGSAHGGHVYQSDGGDFAFTDKDGKNKLSHEIEAYDETTGKLVAWVKVPEVSASTDTVIYVYYGNSNTGLANQWSNAEVWDDGGKNYFKGVWHVAETGTGERGDSTQYTNNCISLGYDGNEAIDGKIGGADQLDGTDDWLSCGQNPSLNIQEEITISAWIKPSSSRIGKDKWFNGLWKKESYGFYLYGRSDKLTTLGADFKIDGQKIDSSDNGSIDIPPDAWSYLVVTYDGNVLKAYVNAKLDYTISSPGKMDNSITEALNVSEQERDKGLYLKGAIDEMRVSGKTRSADWITTCFNNQKSPTSFYSMGNEVTR